MKKDIKISDAELEVLKIIWKKGIANSLEIIDEIKKDFKWNESTIRTLMARLQSKGAIDIERKEGRIYFYKSLINENEYKLKQSKDFLRKMYNGSIKEMMLNFVKDKGITKEEAEELMKLIEIIIYLYNKNIKKVFKNYKT